MGASEFLDSAREDVLSVLPTGILGVPWFQLRAALSQRDAKDMEDKRRDKRFLSQYAEDKKYLENLEGRVEGWKEMGGVKKEVEGALDFLQERRDFWSQQKPDYATCNKNTYKNMRKYSAWVSAITKVMETDIE